MAIYIQQHTATVGRKVLRWWAWHCLDCGAMSAVRYSSGASAMAAGHRVHDCPAPEPKGGA